MARIGFGKVDERDARVGLAAPAGQDGHAAAVVCHQAGVMANDALDPSHHRRGGIMEQGNVHGTSFAGGFSSSCEAQMARSINTAEDQPKIAAALGGFWPVSG